MRRPRVSQSAPAAAKGPPDPEWSLIDSSLVMLVSISLGFNWARWFCEGAEDGWQFSWPLQLALCWSAWPLRKHLPLPVLGVPLERGYSLAAALLPARPLRWLCPDLWLALLLLYRLGLTMPPLMAARITELRSATMQCFPENWQPDQQIVTTVVKI
ncbi:uncharacterized protein LOC122387890 [Amphibalanus amphitrite]|uniref:uncharacterized protein LOC122387890 n=1 Tax=Amphibalanus amphitrite TaxID=1232801 RepID=UPI001C921678|nr:uncharacterized protein LOC122387890 [Amphibalanus amphitrite]